MPTAVTELELKHRSGGLAIPGGYSRALVLVRWSGRPIGQLELPVEQGGITGEVLEAALQRWADWGFWCAWLHDSLGWDEVEDAFADKARTPRATVAVCTHDRANELARCLHALMALPDDGQEYLVVDNRPSSDSSARVTARYPRVRYVRQDEGGLNAARNRAIREARHEIVAFTDDDAFVDAGWLRGLCRNFGDPLVRCATGLTLPAELETEAQQCFQRYAPFGRGYVRRVFDVADMNPMAVGPVGAGANMALRRAIIGELGWFDEALDAGTPSRSGGDHEMFSRILAAGYRIVYDPAALSWHRHRRTERELIETVRGYGTGVYAMWTRALLENREWSVLKQAFEWLRSGQLPELLRSLHPRRRRVPLRLVVAELRGCLSGPAAYLSSRRALRRRQRLGQRWNPDPAAWGDGSEAVRRT